MKGAELRTGRERPFLATKGFNTNLVQFLHLYYVIISNVHICCFTCTISYNFVHAQAPPKTVLSAWNLAYKKYNLWSPDGPMTWKILLIFEQTHHSKFSFPESVSPHKKSVYSITFFLQYSQFKNSRTRVTKPNFWPHPYKYSSINF